MPCSSIESIMLLSCGPRQYKAVQGGAGVSQSETVSLVKRLSVYHAHKPDHRHELARSGVKLKLTLCKT
jgi:hypothetical protein